MHVSRAKDVIPPEGHPKDWVAIILALGLVISMVLMATAILHNSLTSGDVVGIGENATQILIAVFGGIIGILGSYVGSAAYRQGQSSERARTLWVEQATIDDGEVPPPPTPRQS